jgi:phosphatidylglycerophosphatase A
MKRDWAWWVATVCGIGYVPFAPGTAGSAAGLAAVWGLERWVGPWGVAVALMIGIPAGVAAAGGVAASLKQADPSVVVIDEVCGMLIALIGLSLTPLTVLVAFLLFRLFDIVKPYPISWAERRVPGGWGIMVDDLLAGLAAQICVRLLLVWWT